MLFSKFFEKFLINTTSPLQYKSTKERYGLSGNLTYLELF
jgi:hypothetical protein